MINKKLFSLYQGKWKNLSKELQQINSDSSNELKASNPLLINIDEDKFYASDIKLMIFGQETNSWYGDFNSNIKFSLEKYSEFFNSDKYYSYGGQFWNGVKKFKKKLEEKYPQKNIYLIWNNLCKIGNSQRNTNTAAKYILEIENKHFSIINEEIKIINPDIILFFTGPNYDCFIDNIFLNIQKIEVNGFNYRQLIKLDFGEKQNIFRTYHPNYLWRKKGLINEVYDRIIENLDKSLI